MRNTEAMLYVGTYTNGKSEGIYQVFMDRNGRLEVAGLAAKLKNPTYLTFSRDGRYLYAVLENENYSGNVGGAAAAYKKGGDSGNLELLNIVSTAGRGACHLTVDSLNHYLYTANYTDGSVTVFSLEGDGCIGPMQSHIHHYGSGPDKVRQEGPHAHCVMLTPDEKILCAVDLGIDKIVMYDLGLANGAINPDQSRTTGIRPGSGPRHLVFHPAGNFAYLINELSSDIVLLNYIKDTGEFIQRQYISALPENYSGESYCAAIKVSPDGKFLYVSNRGHDSIAVFKIDKSSGTLSVCGHRTTMGSYPRDFEIHPSGKFIVAANQKSGTLVSYFVDTETGMPETTGSTVAIADAVCVVFDESNK